MSMFATRSCLSVNTIPQDSTFAYSTLARQTDTEEYLIQLTQTFISLMNSRAYDNPFFQENVSPDVRVDLQGHVTVGLEGFLGNYKKDASASPGFHVGVENSSALVDEALGSGTVILSQILSGYGPGERTMAGSILMAWNWTNGKWMCISVCMMLGTPCFLV